MCPRPRTVTDEDLIFATTKTMARLGPMKLTLAEVAKDAGVSAATLVQRFGSKRALLLAVSAAAARGTDECFAALRKDGRSPLDAVIDGASMLAEMTNSPEELGNSLAFLQIDVTDPEFRRPMLEMSRKTIDGYAALLEEAVAAGELKSCDTRALARAVTAVAGGSIINWAVFRTGSAVDYVRTDVETLLAPYRVTSPGSSRSRRSAARRAPRTRGGGTSPRAGSGRRR
jgi:AcrR family transcriptional regulator